MNRAEFASEFGGILRLLREHSFLAYSPTGQREYEQKIKSCSELFAYLVYKKTGVPVRVPSGLVPIEGVREPTFAAARALALRAGKRARAAAKKSAGLAKESMEECAVLWERAVAKLSEPDAD